MPGVWGATVNSPNGYLPSLVEATTLSSRKAVSSQGLEHGAAEVRGME